MKRYRVMVREFRWNGRLLGPGDTIEADNTQEILTNCVLGRLNEIPVEKAAPPPVEAPMIAEPAPEPDTSPPAPPPAAAPMTTEDMPTTPPRRRYQRRDTPIEG